MVASFVAVVVVTIVGLVYSLVWHTLAQVAA